MNELITSNELLLLCLCLTAYGASAPGSFMYSLRDHDCLAPFKAKLKDENDQAAIHRYSDRGPIFKGPDSSIANNARSNTSSCTNFGYVCNPSLVTHTAKPTHTPGGREQLLHPIRSESTLLKLNTSS